MIRRPNLAASLALLLSLVLTLPHSSARVFAACDPGTLFAPVIYYPTGVFATSLAAGDFNGDGITDVAVVNLSGNTLSILIGRPDGTFAGQVTYPAGSLPRGIATADLDGDGILDLAVTNVGTPAVSILKGLGSGGHGNGTFAALTSFGAGSENRGIAIADLNGDLHPDLVIAGRTSVAVLMNVLVSGSWGSFGAAGLYTTAGSWGVALGDFDGDGVTDIAAGNWTSPQVSILLGSGGGLFHAGATVFVPGGCADITSGDLNRDGIRDLVAAGSTGIWVMLGNGTAGHGNGTFSTTTYASFGRQYNDVLIGDFNGDGLADVAATDTDGQQLVYLAGDGAGHLGPADFYPAGNGPIGIESFDGNGDSVPDIYIVLSASQGYPGALAVLSGRCLGADPPTITAVRDVPNDQGGKVYVAWLRSRTDNARAHGITGYRVWRRAQWVGAVETVARELKSFDPAVNAGVELRRSTPDGAEVVEYWEPLATLPAAYLEGYAYTAATTQDSSRHGNPYTAFFVQALTPDPYVFYNSPVDSGYSKDNLPPHSPAPFTAVYSGGITSLHWAPCADPDFEVYRIYRGGSNDFEPGQGNLVSEQPDTGRVVATSAPYFYKLCAVDTHDNQSAWLIAQPAGTAAAPGPLVVETLWLGTTVPSPAFHGARLRFGLPRDARVHLAIYDAGGRLVRVLIGTTLIAGEHSVRWDGADASGRAAPSGIYFIRLTAAGRTLSRLLVAVN